MGLHSNWTLMEYKAGPLGVENGTRTGGAATVTLLGTMPPARLLALISHLSKGKIQFPEDIHE